ncbi:TetR/AcrR family transcriptional regulator [Pseudonocardia acidicola]|uniref:TetR/AcrR family transcriptional regulator n=1 Tax=Pseudonocardia acidicola TaxID=2724939 RepID=A0ABX1SKE6_9PSEU|nr:TetR/AcrR family transcriptional regulator [Pseudonocardia acidicola]NMI02040.1 TetR/AcrR family transcriptional regulator [Pseudonocardia acidicola]
MTARAEAAEQTHRRILAAARARFANAPYEEVTLGAIAKEAGVSTQTLLNRFGSKDNLFLEYALDYAREIDALRATARVGDARAAIRVVLRQYEMMGDLVIRVLALEDRFPAFAEVSRIGRERHRAWIEEIFAADLPAGARDRRSAVLALFAAMDVYTWKLLRRDLGVSQAETARVMERLVRGALVPPD